MDKESREFTVVNRIREFGKSRIVIECPFCGELTIAYLWSFSAVGKKCKCGAHHYYMDRMSVKKTK